MWLFGIKLMDDISVNGYISEGIMVTLSPFVFRRFETDMYSKNFSAVVGNSKHDRHYFNIGPDAPLLDRHDSVPLRFRVFRHVAYIMISVLQEVGILRGYFQSTGAYKCY
ncbi:CSS-motif domain-containing protein [Klebsiella pneumoniae]